ncbi:MAG: mechanosensitive ion channel domain-containing protein, partial [Hyphomicrobiaceae bacterium]
MIELPAFPDWLWWGLAIVAFLPIATVVLNEAGLGLDRQERTDLSRPIGLLRTTCLPLLFLVLMLRKVAGLDGGHMLVRIADTAFWITVINVGLLFFNLFFFGSEQSKSWSQKTPKLFLDLLRLFLVAIGTAIVISEIWGVDLGGLLTALGVGSIVIGLALQDTLGSLFYGIALLSARHYREGDWLQVGTHEGVVVNMNWRSVSLRTRSGDILILPNTDLAKQHVRNISAFNGWHSELIDIELAYDHPPETVMKMITKTAQETPGVISNPAPDARIKSYGDKAICYQARIFMADYGRAPVIKSEFQSLFWYRAQRTGLIFPAAHNRLYRIPEGPYSQSADLLANKAQTLGDIGAFSRGAEAMEPLVANAHIDRFGKGETLIAAGRAAATVYVVLEGAARAIHHERHNGKDIDFHEFGPGQVILFKSMFRNEPSRFDVRSVSGMKVMAIPVNDVSAFLAGDPDLAQEIERMMSQREANADHMIRQNNPDAVTGPVTDDRVKLLEEMFQS